MTEIIVGFLAFIGACWLTVKGVIIGYEARDAWHQWRYEQTHDITPINTDKSVRCSRCNRYPELWEDAFPHGICENCCEELFEQDG